MFCLALFVIPRVRVLPVVLLSPEVVSLLLWRLLSYLLCEALRNGRIRCPWREQKCVLIRVPFQSAADESLLLLHTELHQGLLLARQHKDLLFSNFLLFSLENSRKVVVKPLDLRVGQLAWSVDHTQRLFAWCDIRLELACPLQFFTVLPFLFLKLFVYLVLPLLATLKDCRCRPVLPR